MDSDKAATRVSRMWWRIGRLLEAMAVESAQKRYGVETILGYARAADAAYWQATGEMDASTIKDLASEHTPPKQPVSA